MTTFATRIEAMEHAAREREVGMLHKLNKHEQVLVSYNRISARFEYYKVDKRLVNKGVTFDNGYTDLTRNQASALIA